MQVTRSRRMIATVVALGLLGLLGGVLGLTPAGPPPLFAAANPWAPPVPTLTVAAALGVLITPLPTPQAEAVPLYPGAAGVTTYNGDPSHPARMMAYQAAASAFDVRLFYAHLLTDADQGWMLLDGSYSTAHFFWKDPARQAFWSLSLLVSADYDIPSGCSRVTLDLRRQPEVDGVPLAPDLAQSALPTAQPYPPGPGLAYRTTAPWDRIAAYYAVVLPQYGWEAQRFHPPDDPGLRFAAGWFGQDFAVLWLRLTPGRDAPGYPIVTIDAYAHAPD